MQDDIKYKILKSLEDNPQQSQRELSRSVGVSLGKINYCLKALIETGLVKAKNFHSNPQKSAYMYLLTPRGAEEKARVTVRFLKRKVEEYENLGREIERLHTESENGSEIKL